MMIRLRIIFFSILLITCTHLSKAQTVKELKRDYKTLKNNLKEWILKDYPKKNFNAYTVADSLKGTLIKSGVDTIMLFYQTVIKPNTINEDGTDDHKLAFLLYTDSDSIYIQKINDFAIYKPISSRKWSLYPDNRYVFYYYLQHQEDIYNQQIEADKGRRFLELQDDLKSLSKISESLTVIDLKISNKSLKKSFPGIEMHYYRDAKKFRKDISKELYSFILLIENSLNSDNRKWQPLTEIKYMSEAEKQAKFERLNKQIDADYEKSLKMLKSKHN